MTDWLRRPVSITRSALLAGALVLGLLSAGGIIAGVLALQHASAERHRAVAVDKLTTKDVAAIAKRIFRIESPTPAEFVEQIRRALRVCAADPKCSRAFRETVTSANAPALRRAAPTPTASTPIRQRSPSAQIPTTRPRTTPDRRRRRSPTGGAPEPTTPAPSPEPTPTVDVHTPQGLPAPQLCTPLVGINC